MANALSQTWSIYQAQKKECLTRVRSLPVTILSRRQNPDAWSVLDNLEHLALVEDRSAQIVTRSLEKSAAMPRQTLKGRIRGKLIKIAMRMPIKVKAPVEQIVPKGGKSLEEIEQMMRGSSARWESAIQKITDDHVSKQLFNHPIFGWLTAQQTIDFLITHFERHCRQIERGLSA